MTIVLSKTATNNTANTSVITPKMPAKAPKKVKKEDFNILKFLLQHHTKSLVYEMPVPANTTWYQMLRRSHISAYSAMLFLVDKDNTILYIGQTNNISPWAVSTNQHMPDMPVAIVYAVCNKNPGMYVHSVTAYRATFKPKFNSERNTRFVFSPANAVLNVTSTNVTAVDWIKANVNSTYTEFTNKFSQSEMHKLCRLHGVTNYSYKALKAKLLNNK
jgi:hypothetical protein